MRGRVKLYGHAPGPASWWLTAALFGVGLAWLFGPVLLPGQASAPADLPTEALWVSAALVVLQALLGVALWADSGREYPPLALAFSLLVVTVTIRLCFTIGSGVEFSWVAIFLAGVVAGGPLGCLVGAAAAVLSAFLIGEIGVALPAQIVVGGLAGLLGGLFRRLRGWLAVAAVPLAGLGFGLVAGPLLALAVWPIDPQADPGFVAVAPPITNLVAWWTYSHDVSGGVDLMRGLSTAVGLVACAPLVSAMRRLVGPSDAATAAVPDPDIDPTMLHRLERSSRVTQLWKEDS